MTVTIKPSLSNILNKSVFIQSHTLIGHDGRVQSYCGLKLADIHALGPGSSLIHAAKKMPKEAALTFAVVYEIEFQKRGLPHAHILLWLEERWKCMNPTKIDDIISAELPSPVDDPEGYKVVTKYMLHGPCSANAKYAPCTTDGKSLKHFPKSFLAETIIDEDVYAIYRRRNSKVTAKKGKFVYDNKHVVPHNSKKKEAEDEPTWIQIPEEFLIKSWNSPIEKIVSETCLDFTTRQTDDQYLKERAIITPRIDDADAINEYMFKKLGGESVTYNSADKI
ncbi:ATP-dependent DNA helicase PIF1-like protein, partial [Tanacetum coccineum]